MRADLIAVPEPSEFPAATVISAAGTRRYSKPDTPTTEWIMFLPSIDRNCNKADGPVAEWVVFIYRPIMCLVGLMLVRGIEWRLLISCSTLMVMPVSRRELGTGPQKQQVTR